MNKNRNNKIDIILNPNKTIYFYELSICSAVGYEININLDFHLYFYNRHSHEYMKKY